MLYYTYNYINLLRKKNIITKKKYNYKTIFFFDLKTTTKLNLIINFLLLKTILKSLIFKFNLRSNRIYFSFSNLFENKEWYKYFLKMKYLKKKIKKISTLFFLYDLKLLNNYRKINYNLFFYNINYKNNLTKFYLLFK